MSKNNLYRFAGLVVTVILLATTVMPTAVRAAGPFLISASHVQAKTPAMPLIASGDLVWARGIGGAGIDDGQSIATDSNGNVYTIGFFEETADFDPGPGVFNLTSAGLEDIFIVKLDGNGEFVWAKRIGGAGNDEGWRIAIDSSGHVYTTGSFQQLVDFDPGVGIFNLSSSGGFDVFITKLDGDGNLIWAKGFGANSIDAGQGIAIDSNSNVYTTGLYQLPVDFDPGPGVFTLTPVGSFDIYISKLDTSGNFVWARSMGGTDPDMGDSIAIDSNDNVYTTGLFEGTADFDPGAGIANLTSAGSDDIFISKLDSNGDFVWAHRMGGSDLDAGLSIKSDPDGNILLTGIFRSTVDFDPGVGSFNLTSAGDSDIFVSKLDGDGNFTWARSMGGTQSDVGFDIVVDPEGNSYFTGFYIGTVDFDPGVGIFNLTSTGLLEIYVSKLDGNGNLVWAKSLGGSGIDVGFGIAVDSMFNVYTTGFFGGTFDTGTGNPDLTSVGFDDVFISKLEGDSDQALEVSIDILPGSASNPINTRSTGTIPVAILSTATFNAPAMVDRTSLTFGRTGDEVSLASCNTKGTTDVNFDGLPDLLCNFRIQLAGFRPGDAVGVLKGETVGGTPLEGHDTVKIHNK